MIKNNYFILSGAMGRGKSTILKLLKQKGYLCIDEPARQIISEQRSIDGEGLYDKNPELFAQLMLSRSINLYELNSEYKGKVIFDRGIPDLIAYADIFNIKKEVYLNASKLYSYNTNVFMFKGWKEIYTTDDERKMDYESADKFGSNVSYIYKELGYNLIEVPFDSVEKRVEFIINLINSFK